MPRSMIPPSAFALVLWLAQNEPTRLFSVPRENFASQAVVEEEPATRSVLQRAMGFLGMRYRLGASGGKRGIDCSQLTRLSYEQAGIELPWTAALQFHHGAEVLPDELSPGDLVFFRNTYKRGISHVGLYLGEGRFVHASGRHHGVVVSELAEPYYQSHWAGARRLVGASSAVATSR
jgi:cell wall-associated NlpC family hydrolase